MNAVLVELVRVAFDDGRPLEVLVIFDLVEGTQTTNVAMLGPAHRCTPIDSNSWRVDATGEIVRREKTVLRIDQPPPP